MIAFKEWTLICDALGRGTQSIILRKGGIAEGRAGFRFQHYEFLLFPTLFHEQVAKLKLPPETAMPEQRPDLEISLRARVEWTREVADLDAVRRLAPFHLWRDEVIEERFRYDEKQSVSLAFVRVSRLVPPLIFPDAPRYGGCRSWIEVPDLSGETAAEKVLGDAEHRAREQQILAALCD